MPRRTAIGSNRVWSSVGYSRAVRVDDVIEVAGTSASAPDGQILFPGDMYRQARYVCDLIGQAVRDLGGEVADVTRTRVFVTDISRWQEAGRAHGETFGENPPASAFYQVAALLHPDLLIEVEATAIVGSGRDRDPSAPRVLEGGPDEVGAGERQAVPVSVWNHRQLIDEGLTALRSGGGPGTPMIDGRVLGVRATPADGTAGQMALGISALPAGYATPSHHHEAEEVATVLSGTGVIVIDGVEYPVTAGSVVLTPSNSEHVTVAGPEEPLVVWWAYAPAGSERRWLEQDPGR